MILLKNSSRPLDAPKDSESNPRLRFALTPKLSKLQGQNVYCFFFNKP